MGARRRRLVFGGPDILAVVAAEKQEQASLSIRFFVRLGLVETLEQLQ